MPNPREGKIWIGLGRRLKTFYNRPMNKDNIQKSLPSPVELWFEQVMGERSNQKRPAGETAADVVMRLDVQTFPQFEYALSRGANPNLIKMNRLIAHYFSVFCLKTYQALLVHGRKCWDMNPSTGYYMSRRWTKMSDVGELIAAGQSGALKFSEIWKNHQNVTVAVTDKGEEFGAVALALLRGRPLDAFALMSRGLQFVPAPHFDASHAARQVLDAWLVSKGSNSSMLLPFQKVWSHLREIDPSKVEAEWKQTKDLVTILHDQGREAVPHTQWSSRPWKELFGGYLSSGDLRTDDEAWRVFLKKFDDLQSTILSPQEVEAERSARQNNRNHQRQQQQIVQSEEDAHQKERLEHSYAQLVTQSEGSASKMITLALNQRSIALLARALENAPPETINTPVILNTYEWNRSKKTKEGPTTTFLHMACQSCDLNAIKLLMDKGADCNAVGHLNNVTPLHLLLLHSHNLPMPRDLLTRARQLVKKMDGVDHKNKQGDTLLLHLLAMPNVTMDRIHFLLASGADPLIKNNKGLDALGVLASNKYQTAQDEKSLYIKTFINNIQRNEIKDALDTHLDIPVPDDPPRKRKKI